MPSALTIAVGANEECRMSRFNLMLALADALEHLLPRLKSAKKINSR
ncbi:hypothetical protein LCGC14_0847640 [marine sediment metagenome]|uniref:Uncharacterized protein n=1 Tax=marine sediment metagenome TaxID=412755 RepID=A0A0F9RW41_9ZZZZ